MQHLGVLEDTGLITSEKIGRVRTCSLKPEAMQPAMDWLAEQRAIWTARFDRLDNYLGDFRGGRIMTEQAEGMLEGDRIGDLDLVISRLVKAPRHLVWEAWTNPDHLKKWWYPRPYQMGDCKLEMRPGGAFNNVMIMPDGEEMENFGCILDVEDRTRIVFTDSLHEGWRPSPEPFMTAIIDFADEGQDTRYITQILHHSKANLDQHISMGFFTGWGTCISQLEEVAQSLM